MASRVPYPFHLVSTVDVPGTYRYKGKVISRHLTRLAADYAANRPYLRGTCEVVENTEYEEQKAVRVNQARLLAAAPEMLLIIEEIVNYLPSDEGMALEGKTPAPLVVKMRRIVQHLREG